MLLEDQHIKLRALEPNDIDLLYEWENNTEIWQVSNTLVPFSRHLLQQYIEAAHPDIFEAKQLRLIIETQHPRQSVGCIDLFDFDPFHLRAGVGILIHKKQDRRKKYATQALKLLIDYALGYLKLHQLYCHIAKDNSPSLKLFQSAGFEITGTKKDWVNTQNGWRDQYFLQKIATQ